jgi:hypothetical protein
MMNYDTRVFLPYDVLQTLGEHTGLRWPDPMLEPVICDAILAWMKPAPPAERQPAAPSQAGYQWKQVFLPEGTRLRASFRRESYFAVVQGARIKYGKQSLSPSGFANLRGSGNRNAWKAIWLRLPGSDEWLLADVCRSARNSAIARLFGADAPAAQPGRRAAPRARQEPHDKSKRRSKRPAPQARTGTHDGERAAVAGQPVAPPSGPRPSAALPSGAPEAAHGHNPQRKGGTGRSARSKRRAAKHGPAYP